MASSTTDNQSENLTKFNNPVLVYTSLFLRSNRNTYIRDLVILGLILIAFFSYSWYQDPEAINFMFFIFGCFLLSTARYPQLFQKMEILPDSQTSSRHTKEFASALLLNLPFLVTYLAITQHFVRFLILLGTSIFFLLSARWLPKWFAYVNLALIIAIFLYIRYKI